MDFSGLWGSIKAAVDVNPWRAAAIALAGGLIFALRAWGALPFELPDWALTVIGVVTMFAAAFALMDFLRAVVFGIGAAIRWFVAYWAMKRAQARVLRHLDTLTQEEKEIFGRLLARNERNFDGAIDGGHAQGLIANGLVERPSQFADDLHTAYVVPRVHGASTSARRDSSAARSDDELRGNLCRDTRQQSPHRGAWTREGMEDRAERRRWRGWSCSPSALVWHGLARRGRDRGKSTTGSSILPRGACRSEALWKRTAAT